MDKAQVLKEEYCLLNLVSYYYCIQPMIISLFKKMNVDSLIELTEIQPKQDLSKLSDSVKPTS